MAYKRPNYAIRALVISLSRTVGSLPCPQAPLPPGLASVRHREEAFRESLRHVIFCSNCRVLWGCKTNTFEDGAGSVHYDRYLDIEPSTKHHIYAISVGNHFRTLRNYPSEIKSVLCQGGPHRIHRLFTFYQTDQLHVHRLFLEVTIHWRHKQVGCLSIFEVGLYD